MLTKLLLQKIWLSIEHLEEEVLDLTDLELVHRMQLEVATETMLNDGEIHSITKYIQYRIPLIRDLVELRFIKLKKENNFKSPRIAATVPE